MYKNVRSKFDQTFSNGEIISIEFSVILTGLRVRKGQENLASPYSKVMYLSILDTCRMTLLNTVLIS